MSKCLSEVRVRAAADNEATQPEREHLEQCDECRARVEAARRAASDLLGMAAALMPPTSLQHRVRQAVLRADQSGGATTLREQIPFRARPRVWATAVAVATAVVLMVFALPPLDAPRAVTAAEILDRSLQTLTASSGVELREFDLDLRPPRATSLQAGTYRMEQLVDHATPGRFRAVRYHPDGTLLDAISQDPGAKRRTVVVNVDGQLFTFRFAMPSGPPLDLPALERQHVEAVIRVLQAMAGEAVQEIADSRGKRYVVELPAVADRKESGLWELSRARVTIDADDFQILELTAAGSYMGDPFSVAFRLRNRQVWSSAEVPPDRFNVPTADAITIDGVATDDIARDLLASALREVARRQ